MLTAIIDPTTGHLTVEADSALARSLAREYGGAFHGVNCGRPQVAIPLPAATANAGATVRVARMWQHSVVEGPGIRNVVQLQGCPIRCPGCYVPETHDLYGGVILGVADVVAALTATPHHGVTILGGEPFQQPQALLALVTALQARGEHITVYSGYKLVWLAGDEVRRDILSRIDVLIDGPFVAALRDGAGEWRGSLNQRVLDRAAIAAALRVALAAA